MPNHITTVCTIAGPASDLAEILRRHVTVSDDPATQFDFETIIPMPQSIKNTFRPHTPEQRKPGEPVDGVGDHEVTVYAQALTGGRREHIVDRPRWLPTGLRTAGELLDYLDKTKPAAAFWAKRLLLASADTGYPGWYEWSIANWGTKWGSYRYKERQRSPELVFEFQTAWSVPAPILRKLSEMHPFLTVRTESIDEGGGAFIGTFDSGAGGLVKVEETREMHVRVYGCEPDDEEDDDGGDNVTETP